MFDILGLTEMEKAVLRILRKSKMAPSWICFHAKIAPSTLTSVLRSLLKRGLIVKTGIEHKNTFYDSMLPDLFLEIRRMQLPSIIDEPSQ